MECKVHLTINENVNARLRDSNTKPIFKADYLRQQAQEYVCFIEGIIPGKV